MIDTEQARALRNTITEDGCEIFVLDDDTYIIIYKPSFGPTKMVKISRSLYFSHRDPLWWIENTPQ